MIWTEIFKTIRHFQILRQQGKSQDVRTVLGIFTAKLLDLFDAEYVAIHQVQQIPMDLGEGGADVMSGCSDRPKIIWESEVWAEASSTSDPRFADMTIEDLLFALYPCLGSEPKNIFEIYADLPKSELASCQVAPSVIFTDKPYCVIPILDIEGEAWGCLSICLSSGANRSTESENCELGDPQVLSIVWKQDQLVMLQEIVMQLEILLHYEIQHSQLQNLREEMDNSYSTLFHWTEQYRSLIEQVPSVSYVLPIDGNMDFSYISPRLQVILSIPLKIWNTGYINGWKQYIHPSDRDRVQEAVNSAIASGGSMNCEYRMITYDGRFIWVSDNAIVGTSSDGYTKVLRGSILDISDRKESELRFKGIFDNTFQFVGLSSTDGIILEINQTALDFGGIEREQVVGLPIWETYWLSNSLKNQEMMKQALQRASQGEFVRYEMDILGRDQTTTTIDFSMRPVKDESGRTILLIPEGRDISELKATEMALRRSESQLAQAQRVAKLGNWEWDLETNQISWSQELFKIYQRDPALGSHSYEEILQIFEPKDRQKLKEAVDHAIATGESYRLELKMLRTDQSSTYVEAIGHVEHNPEGRVVGLYGTVQDISDRKQTELKLLENKTLLKLTIDHAPIGIATFDLEGKFLTVNHQFCQIFGYTSEEVLQMTAIEMTHHESVDKTLKALNQLLTNQATTVQIDKQYVHKLGHTIDVISRLGLVKDADGKPMRFVAGVEDITERQQIEKQLAIARLAEAANRAKSEFLAVMSHELRTPMNAVVGMTEILMGTDLSEQQKQYVATIRQGGEVLVSVINDILDFSRIESGHVQIEESPVSLQQCLEEVLDLMTAKVTEKSLEVAVIIEPSVPASVLSDYARLRQILVNLVSNAIKFTDSGAITITLDAQLIAYEPLTEAAQSEQGNFYNLLFQVQDSGIGIAPEAIAKLFQPFSQADYSISRQYGGTGLGLAICKQLCERMGGTIAVESTVGQGSIFKFSVRIQAIASSPLSLEIAPELINKNILIINDYESIQRAIALYAQNLQVTVHSSSASEVIANLSSLSNFDAVLIDRHLTDSDAMDLAITIKQKYPHLPLVLLTFVTKHQQSCPEIFDSCLVKPITASKLQKSLTDIFQSSNVNVIPESTLKEDAPLLDANFAERLPLRILIVEDNLVNQQILQLMLELLGYEIKAVENGLEALREIAQCEYDLIFMDIQMPIMDGLTASRQVRQLSQPQPWIIGLSADAFTESRDVAISAGMNDYLTKPLQTENLISALRKVTRQSPYPASSTAINTTYSVFDRSILKTLELSIGKQNMMNLLVIYLNHSKQAIADMRTYLQAQNISALDAVNHSLKGGSATFGVVKLFNVCQELEIICRDLLRNVQDIQVVFTDLEDKLHKIETIFQNVLQAFDPEDL